MPYKEQPWRLGAIYRGQVLFKPLPLVSNEIALARVSVALSDIVWLGVSVGIYDGDMEESRYLERVIPDRQDTD